MNCPKCNEDIKEGGGMIMSCKYCKYQFGYCYYRWTDYVEHFMQTLLYCVFWPFILYIVLRYPHLF